MGSIVPLPRPVNHASPASRARRRGPEVETHGVYVVYTGIDGTLAAFRAAAGLARAFGVAITVVHFRVVANPVAPPVVDASPVESDAFLGRLREEGVDTHVRVFVCRAERQAIPIAFSPHSIVVIAGRRRWWPTTSERLRRQIEKAGHFVVSVDTAGHRKQVHA